MKKIFYLLLLLPVFSFSQEKINRSIGDFNSLSVHDGIELEIVKSDMNMVDIYGPKSNKVIVKNKNGNLKIRTKFFKKFSEDKIKVVLKYKQLSSIISSRGSEIFSKDTITQQEITIISKTKSKQKYIINNNFLNSLALTGGKIFFSGNTKYHKSKSKLLGVVNAQELLSIQTEAKSISKGIININASALIDAFSVTAGTINIYTKTTKIIERTLFGGKVNLLYE